MGYVVVVFGIINTAALLGVAWLLMGYGAQMEETVLTAIQEEVRKQDDRIEKRRQRAEGPAQDEQATPLDIMPQVVAGRPTRR